MKKWLFLSFFFHLTVMMVLFGVNQHIEPRSASAEFNGACDDSINYYPDVGAVDYTGKIKQTLKRTAVSLQI